MLQFPRNFRDILLSTATTRTLLIAALVVTALFVVLPVAYSALDLGALFSRGHP